MGIGIRDDSRLHVYAYFYYMAVGAGINPDLAAVFIRSRLWEVGNVRIPDIAHLPGDRVPGQLPLSGQL